MASPGLRIIWIYFGLTYGLPFLFNSIFNLGIVSSYRIYPAHVPAIIFVILLGVLLFLLDDKAPVAPTVLSETPRSQLFRARLARFRLAVAILFVFIAFLAQRAGLNDFRYAEQSAFVQGSFLLYGLALIPLVLKFDFFYHVFFLGTPHETGKVHRAARLLMLLALLLTINGTSSSLFAFFYFLYTFFPNQLTPLMLKSARKIRLGHWLALPLIGIFVMGVGWIVGETVKRSGDSEGVLTQVLEPAFLQWSAYWFMERTSSSYYAYLMTFSERLLNFSTEPLENLLIPLKTLLFRLDVFLGQSLGVAKPALSSINRLNEELLSLDLRERAGASPGLIASFLYCFPFPLNIAALVGYCVVFIRFMNSLFRKMPVTPNLGGLALITWISLVFFESPIDLLVIFDEGNILLLLILALTLMGRRTRKISVRAIRFPGLEKEAPVGR